MIQKKNIAACILDSFPLLIVFLFFFLSFCKSILSYLFPSNYKIPYKSDFLSTNLRERGIESILKFMKEDSHG